MKPSTSGFHFQPLQDQELSQTDNASLLFNSKPPSRKGRVTLFLKTRRSLRRRLGVHDLGQIESVFQEPEREVVHEEMKQALGRMTQWRYLFPPEMRPEAVAETPKVDTQEFRAAVGRTLERAG